MAKGVEPKGALDLDKTRILVYDIETSPLTCYTWSLYPQDGVIELIDDYQILTVAWHWIGDDKRNGEPRVKVIGQDDLPGYIPGVNDDTEIVKVLWELFDEADVIVAHNGDSFDQKKSQARMMIRGMDPPTPYIQVDTKKLAKRIGAFTSNSLKNLANDLGVSQKGNSGGFETWKGCLAGEKKHWRKMKQYNKEDIPPLIDLYKRFVGWSPAGPPINVLEERPDACPKCGGQNLQAGTKYKPTNAKMYQYFRCMSCGGSVKARVPKESDARPRYKR